MEPEYEYDEAVSYLSQNFFYFWSAWTTEFHLLWEVVCIHNEAASRAQDPLHLAVEILNGVEPMSC